MFPALIAVIIIVCFPYIVVGQDGCPTVSVVGPSGIVAVGETAKYRVFLDGTVSQEAGLEYLWSVSPGDIVRGQGTASVDVRRPDRTLTVTVEVKGLRAGCPAYAAMSASYHPPPQPVKLAEYQGELTERLVEEILTALAPHDTNQLFILNQHIEGKVSATSNSRAGVLLARLSGAGIKPDRIILGSVFGDTDLIQIWRVPPGADYPRCVDCEEMRKGPCTATAVIVPNEKRCLP